MSDPAARRGEVWFADVPGDKRRPILVLSRDPMGRVLHSIICAPITSRVRGLSTEVGLGPEAGLAPGTEVAINSAGQTYNTGPYYMNAKLKILSFATSGNWQDSNCGSANNQQGPDDSVGRDWMRAVCEVPP